MASVRPRIMEKQANLTLPLPEELNLLATALEGDAASADRVLAELDPRVAEEHRVAPALALAIRTAGSADAVPASWEKTLMGVTALGLVLDAALDDAAQALSDAEVPWSPIKGCDLGSRVYRQREERPTADLDILIRDRDYPLARRALERSGWRSLWAGDEMDLFVAEEGHCWQALGPGGALLELHLRLWNMVPSGFSAEVIDRATPDPELGAQGRRPDLAHAFILAAVHAWLTPAPRPLLGWWDLERIVSSGPADLGRRVTGTAKRWGLQLPVGLAAAQAASLWDHPTSREIAKALLADLRPSESLAARRARQRGSDGISLTALWLTRLLAGRRSQGAARTAVRRFWAHRGIVARETPSHWPWIVRRLYHCAKRLHLPVPDIPLKSDDQAAEPTDLAENPRHLS